MKKFYTLVIAVLLVLTACGVKPDSSSANIAGKPQIIADTPTATAIVIPTVVPTQSPTSTPTPIPVDIGHSYTGYWLKMVKEVDGITKSQTMTLYYQEDSKLTVIATFCVRAGDNNTPDGFYFIALDRPTTYPTAHGGYANTFFSHNFAWKFSYRNWYLHAAPWNTQGVNGCPVKGSGGCVNMRTDDFNVLLNGGDYINPITGEKSVIPDLGVGTPFIITETENDGKYLGNFMGRFKCVTGRDCFRQYTCEHCIDWGTKWEILKGKNPALKILDFS